MEVERSQKGTPEPQYFNTAHSSTLAYLWPLCHPLPTPAPLPLRWVFPALQADQSFWGWVFTVPCVSQHSGQLGHLNKGVGQGSLLSPAPSNSSPLPRPGNLCQSCSCHCSQAIPGDEPTPKSSPFVFLRLL